MPKPKPITFLGIEYAYDDILREGFADERSEFPLRIEEDDFDGTFSPWLTGPLFAFNVDEEGQAYKTPRAAVNAIEKAVLKVFRTAAPVLGYELSE